MDPRGRRFLIIGDSHSDGARTPGGRLAAELRARGAADVRVNARSGRSAVSLWSTPADVQALTAEAARRPDVVLVFLGTNDIGYPVAGDEAAFRKIAATFPGAVQLAIGPPSFPNRPDLDAGAPKVYGTLARVFGPGNVIDARPLGAADSGYHFSAARALVFARAIADVIAPVPAGAPDAVSSALTAPRWRWTIGSAGLALIGIAAALVIRRRRQLAGPNAGALSDEEREHVHSPIRGEIDEAVERAVAAGAEAPLTYMGAGAEGVVFCDPAGKAYKVGRRGHRGDASLETEAAFFQKANQVPVIARNVARFYRYDRDQDVIVRECIRAERTKKGDRRYMPNADTKAWDTAERIHRAMLPFGFTGPERKPDSFVYVRGRGMVLVDGGFAHKVGHELVRDVLAKKAGRIPRGPFEDDEALASHVRWERDRTIPKAIADRVRAKLGDDTPLDGLGAARDRVVGTDYPAEVVHGTTKKSAQAFLQRRDLPDHERTRTLSEFGSGVLYVAEKTAPHQAVMFGSQGGRTLLALQLAPGRRVLDVASEMQRRPFIGDGGPIAFKGRPSITDDMGRWLTERRAARGLRPIDVALVDPTSPRFSPSDYPDLLATYARDRGYAAVRFTDETVVVDPTAVVGARRLKPAEVTALRTVRRRLPATGPASLYTRDFEDDGEPLGAPRVEMIEDAHEWADIDPELTVRKWVVEDEDEIDGVELRSREREGAYAIAHRTTKPHADDKWQVSWFDDAGAVGDVRESTLVAALTGGASPYEYDVAAVHTKAARQRLRGVRRQRERIPGGLAPSGRCPPGTDPAELRRGIAVELEHTNDRDVAREIACDHLTEDRRYYRKLAAIETA